VILVELALGEHVSKRVDGRVDIVQKNTGNVKKEGQRAVGGAACE
jgi:hypothetical protein